MDTDTKPHGTGSTPRVVTLRTMTMDGQSKAMQRLWTRMASAKGGDSWERKFGPEPLDAWRQALGPFTLVDIARGIDRAEQDASGRVPDLGQFLNWCREFQPGTFAGASRPAAAPPTFAQLEANARTCTGRMWIAFARHEGIWPMGEATQESVAEELDGVDIEAMRQRVASEETVIRARIGR